MENKSELSSAEIYQQIADLIGWIYEVTIDSNAKAEIERQMLAGWYNDDRSEQDLVDYLVNMYGTVQSATGSNVQKLREQARAIFRQMIEKHEPNDRGRVVAAIQQVVEGLRPGATGVPVQLSDPTTGASVSSPGYQPPAPSASPQARASHQSSAALPPQQVSYAVSMQDPQQQLGHQHPPHQHPGYQQMPPHQTMHQQSPPMHGGYQSAHPHHGYPSSSPFSNYTYDISGAADLASVQRNLNRDVQQASLSSNIEKQIHDMNMSIIKNIG